MFDVNVSSSGLLTLAAFRVVVTTGGVDRVVTTEGVERVTTAGLVERVIGLCA